MNRMLFLALLAAACSPAAPKSSEPISNLNDKLVPPLQEESFTFACAEGKSFTVAYDAQSRFATIRAAGKSAVLQSAPSGSGARYAKGRLEFWEHQGEATLKGAPGGPYENCRRA